MIYRGELTVATRGRGTYDITELRSHHPDLMDLDTWLKTTGWTPEQHDRQDGEPA